MDEQKTRSQIQAHADAVGRGDITIRSPWRSIDGRPTLVGPEPIQS